MTAFILAGSLPLMNRAWLEQASIADACKICAKCGKAFKIGTNEAYNMKIKIRLGRISKI